MNGFRQGWLVARREVRERLRSPGLWVGTGFMVLVVIAAVAVPAMADDDTVTRDVGFAGAFPRALPAAVVDQGAAVDVTVRVHRYDDAAPGEEAVRDEDVDVLVVDARRLLWRGDADERLRALVTGAIQLVAIEDRAARAGIDPDELAELTAPVAVESEALGIAAGQQPDDEAAAYVMSILLLVAMATYGQLVLTGVVQEKSSRVVEVLLARMPARVLLAGKVTGIGLLGFAQFAATALAALVTAAVVGEVDVTAVSGDVLAWVVAWFVLGYAMYAVAYGAFGSLASRTEDASSISAPVNVLLIGAYWVSLVAVTEDPEGTWAQVVSLLPVTAPFAMPGRIALGAAAWWEPAVAAVAAVATIAGLAAVAGRVYAGAILRTGATVRLRDAWRRTTTPAGPTHRDSTADRATVFALVIAVVAGLAVGLIAGDVVIGVAVAAGTFAVLSRRARSWAGHRDDHRVPR